MKTSRPLRRKLFYFAVFLLLLLTCALLFWVVAPEQPKFSDQLSAEEQRNISKLVRKHALVTTLKQFTSGELRYGWQRLRDLPRTVVYAQGNQPDGKIWIHVGVPDPSDSEGYRLFSRHFLKQGDKNWLIVGDF